MPLGETDFTEGVGIGEEETEKGAHFIIALKISLATPGEFLAHPLATTCHTASQPTPPPSYPFLCAYLFLIPPSLPTNSSFLCRAV